MASPGSNDDYGAAVCCMCSDHGLPSELFQCGLCRLRLQHRYCSDLYPRVAAYRSCNWCLREENSGGGSSLVTAKRRLKKSRGGKGTRPCVGGCLRSAFSAEPGKPVKKPKKGHGHERAVLRPVATTAANGRGTTTQAGASWKPRFRAKVRVRRYKFLAEVIGC